MLIADAWSQLAQEHGVLTGAPPESAGDGVQGDVELRVPGWAPAAYEVKTFLSPLAPSQLHKVMNKHRLRSRDWNDQPEPLLLVVVPSATERMLEEAVAAGVSVVVTPRGPNDLVGGVLVGRSGELLHLAPRAPDEAVKSARRGRVPWGTFAVAFELLGGPRAWANQEELAVRVGLSQPRVSQILRRLDARIHTLGGADVVDDAVRDRLAGWLVEHYPRQPRLATTWLTLDSPVQAAGQLENYLRSQNIAHVVTGEVAADRLAPWARPSTCWVWTACLADLEPIGATPVNVRDANLTLAVAEDPYVLRNVDESRRTAAPWRVWLDLVHQGRLDSADTLRNALVAGKVR